MPLPKSSLSRVRPITSVMENDSYCQKPMQSAAETLENASILSESSSQEGHRLWIGNIDPKITE
ncbi:hypothetical protein JZ751_012314 [Albula glossodonta]|uniref:Uncharacterized protein n=1 Tax=Albula glossodonta TaxID=121402 RepID=A0A8T2PS60_9TELE|nr:hypothetical protein JZ751_012314 [Albula glossodonta]